LIYFTFVLASVQARSEVL